MSFISKTIEVTFNGESNEVAITMDLINRLEMNGINLLKLQMLVDQEAIPPTSLLSTFYARLLNSAGVDVSPEDVWCELINADPVGLINASKKALSAMFPASKENKPAKKTNPKAKVKS